MFIAYDVYMFSRVQTKSNFTVTKNLIKHVIKYSDYSEGFGGKYGVQSDRVDESAVGWEQREELSKHESQKGITASPKKHLHQNKAGSIY